MIYLDNAQQQKRMKTLSKKCFLISENYGNASSVYDLGSKSKLAITKSRGTIDRH